MSEQSASAAPSPERRTGYADGSLILQSISALKDDLGREMREVKTTLAAMSEKHQGLHMDFARYETEVKVCMTALEQNQTEHWEETRKTQQELYKTKGAIGDHLTATESSAKTKGKLGDNAKFIIALLFGNGILLAGLKLLGSVP